MKKSIIGIVIVLLSMSIWVGCSNQNITNVSTETDTREVVHEGQSVQIIRSMMELEYSSMTVTEFNETIQLLCKDADTNVFEVISDAYDHYSVYDETGEFLSVTFTDSNLESFMETTLSYSSAEIFGEPSHMGSVVYMKTPNMTAAELSQKRNLMTTEEWDLYFQDNIADISIYLVLSYVIEATTPDSQNILVSERDSRLNNIHAAIETFVFNMDTESASADTFEDDVLNEFERISMMYSDDKMTVECEVQGVERDIE